MRSARGFQFVAVITLAPLLGTFCGCSQARGQALPEDPPVFLKPKEAGRLLIDKPKPNYPPLAKQNYIQGHVKIKILVNREGKVEEAHVLSGHPFLAAAALAALDGWRYQPFLTSHGLQSFVTDVQMVFALRHTDLATLPVQPEEDLKRQVRPPRILSRPARAGGPDNLHPASSIHIRVLISEEGKPLDVDPAPGFPVKFQDMRERLASWTFQPARFGSLPVPWYLDVEVQSENWPQPAAGAN